MNGAIAQLGYPAPAVLHWSPDASVLGGAFLILERLPGENLLARVVDPALLRFPALLAEAQLRLHALDPAPIQRAIEAAGFPAARLRPDADLARDRRARARARPRRPRAGGRLAARAASAGASRGTRSCVTAISILSTCSPGTGASPASSTGRCGT